MRGNKNRQTHSQLGLDLPTRVNEAMNMQRI